MDRLAGKVSAAEMQAMNDAVDGKHEDVGVCGAAVSGIEKGL